MPLPFSLDQISFQLDRPSPVWSERCIRLRPRKKGGRDQAGPYTLHSIPFRLGENSALLHVKEYENGCYLWLKNDFPPPFSHRTACFYLPSFPAGRILCFHNTLEGQKIFPTSLKELKFFLRLLSSNLSYFFHRPRSFIRYLHRHAHPNSGYAPWSFPKWVRSWEELPNHCFLAIAQGDPSLVILSAAAHGHHCRLKWEGRLTHEAWAFHPGDYYPFIPGPIITWGDPHEALSRAFSILSVEKPWIRKRGRQNPLRKLGWCTWNAFYLDLKPERVLEGVRAFKRAGVKLGFVLIDDGWGKYRRRMLASMQPSFDMKSLIREMKARGVEKVGVWHALTGYWMGADCELESCTRGSDGRYLPGREFFQRWYRLMKEWGVDFVKVDNQFDLLPSAMNVEPVERLTDEMLEWIHEASERKFCTILNCMSLTPECWVNFRTPLCRASFDYPPDLKELQKKQVLACFYNSLWLSHIAVPDFDMFESSGKYALCHAMSRVLSGGPVYLTDEPEKINPQLVRRLCLDDGTVAVTDGPCLPTQDSLFRDPYQERIPLKVLGKCGEARVLGIFNLCKEGATLKVKVQLADLGIQEGVLYAVERRCLSEKELEITLRELEADIILGVPVHRDVAILGIEPLLLPPAGISRREVKKSGELLIYSRRKKELKILGKQLSLEEGLNRISVRPPEWDLISQKTQQNNFSRK